MESCINNRLVLVTLVFYWEPWYLQTSSTTYLSEPNNLNILVRSQISCVISPFLKLLPCIPCLWNARTLSASTTEKKIFVNQILFFGQDCSIKYFVKVDDIFYVLAVHTLPMLLIEKSKWSSDACRLLDFNFPWRLTTFTVSKTRYLLM